jgi:hypothetical protein
MATFQPNLMDLPARYYSAIGEFLFRYSQLEYQLHEIIWFAMSLGYKRGRVLTIGTDNRVLRGIVSTITFDARWIKDQSLRQEMNYIAGVAKKHSVFRNRLVHGAWCDGGAPRLHYMKEKEYRFIPRYDPKIDDRTIADYAGSLRAANLRAQKLIHKLEKAQPPTSL